MSDFGLTREEVWQGFAQEINATYVPGGFWEREQLRVPIPPWTVIIEITNEQSGTPLTRLQTRLITRNEFAFTLFREGTFRDTGPLQLLPELIVGDETFDREFRVAGTDRDFLLRLLRESHIVPYLMREPQIGLEITRRPFDRFQADLTCVVVGIVAERSRLQHLVELMAETLQLISDFS